MMQGLEGQQIICFAHDWGGDPTSKTHIMRVLSKKNRILWVNSIAMRRPQVSRADLRRLVAKLGRSLSANQEVEPGILVANPLVIPLPGFALAHRLNGHILAASLRRLCRRQGFDRPIFWTFLPYVDRLIGRLGERMLIYQCVDEYSAFSGVPRQAIIRMDQRLVRRADLVITSAAKLRDERLPLNPNTHFVPHGVDADHFGRALEPGTEVPEGLRRLPHPVVGFFGLLADWVDVDLLRELAVARPSWSIALVGKVVTDLASLRDLPNVHVLGQKPYAALPGYCRGFDVGIIPFRLNDLTLRANPLKLREYLAAGLPAVSTPLPEVARYDGLVHLANGVAPFVSAIETALRERSESATRRRVEAMRAEGWEARVAEISALIQRHLDAREAS
jgi:glycosyltransferase involved in cell wall biosynthesis